MTESQLKQLFDHPGVLVEWKRVVLFFLADVLWQSAETKLNAIFFFKRYRIKHCVENKFFPYLAPHLLKLSKMYDVNKLNIKYAQIRGNGQLTYFLGRKLSDESE
ncbi:hypothetical protein ATANTOWER_007907 [Ataeniobius toweri]|uniref:Uncharacterized protein n=1 Tax=Ataeniobius toweri TaxID=208326 RepID=A0ABU7BTZ4_9TELE|nr:hypothetical protein [Ataeniobius toweri]